MSKIQKEVKKISKFNIKKLEKYFKTEKLEKLHNIKIFLDEKWYNSGIEFLSNNNYDLFKEILKYRESEDFIMPIGYEIKKGERIKLPYHMGSMDKFKPENKREIENWLKKYKANNYIIESKLDGISCLIEIENGNIKLYTRGNGEIGTDITHLSKYLKFIPNNIKENITVRGELIIQQKIFNEKYIKEFANARNLVAGKINSKTIDKDITKDINFVAYEIVSNNEMEKPSLQLEKLKKLGFSVVNYSFVNEINVEILINYLLEFKKKEKYEIDGIIIQADNNYKRNKSGNPKYAFAFKMLQENEIYETEVLGIEWNTSKWGSLKPRIKIKEVEINGSKINYTTGFNAKYIKDNKIGKGAKINVTLSGSVIPHIVEVVKKAKKADFPDVKYSWNSTNIDIYLQESDKTMCIKLLHSFFQKLGVKYLGEATVERLFDNGYDNILKIISLKESDLVEIDRINEKLAYKIYTNIQKGIKNAEIYTILGSSGIFGKGIGIKLIKKLMDEKPDILKKNNSKELYNEILKIEGFQEITTKKIVDRLPFAIKFIKLLSDVTELKKSEEKKKEKKVNLKLKNKNIVFTGFRIKEYEKIIEDCGGKVSNSISGKTDILVVKNLDMNNKTAKIKKAIEKDIKIIDKDIFEKEYLN